jgi:hypothetical protein
VRATSNANTSSVVTWNAPAGNGGTAIYGYSVTATDVTAASRGGQTCNTVGTTVTTVSSTTPIATTCTVNGLTNGDQYRFAVSAMSGVGTGAAAWSNVVRPATAPSAPSILKVVPGSGSATVYWSVPTSSGGTPVGSYRVIASPGAAFCHVPLKMLSCRIAGLTNGATYTFTMTATNAAGTSATSVASAPVRVGVAQRVTPPGAPVITYKSVSGRYITIHWIAPTSNGGAALSGYDVYVGWTPNGAALRPVVPVPAYQMSYTFKAPKGALAYIIVRGVNSAGIGLFSNQVAALAR